MTDWITIDEAIARFGKSDSTIRRHLRKHSKKDDISRVRRDGKVELSSAWLIAQFGAENDKTTTNSEPMHAEAKTEQMHLAVESQKMQLLQTELEHSRNSRAQALGIAWKIGLIIFMLAALSITGLIYLFTQAMLEHDKALKALKESTSNAIAKADSEAMTERAYARKLESENLNLKLKMERQKIEFQNIPKRRYLVTADNQPITK